MKFFWILPLFFWVSESWCQVNGYAKVTGISGTTLSLSNVNETYGSFVAGEKAIIMQMQDDVIGDVTDAATFGDIGSIRSAGLYEIVTLSSVSTSSLQTLYQQNFDVNGLTSDSGPNSWSRTNNPGSSVTAQTANNRFEAAHGNPDNQNNTVTWNSNTLDISSYSGISISLVVGELTGNNLEGADFVRVEYILNGVATQFYYQTNDFTSATPSVSGLNGSTLALQVTFFDDDNGETYYLDNVLIQGTSIPTITLASTTVNTYNTGSNSSLQIITYPVLDDGGGNFTTTSDITALDWDGNIGGVVAFKVSGTLTQLRDIRADGAGFRGGSANGDGTSADCSQTPYRTGTGTDHADKGEGIYYNTNANYVAARGKIVSGGGGGNSHNAGGAGGSNYSAGGDGGPGWDALGDCTDDGGSAGGLGGLALSSYITSSRIFLGGGGGAGEGNDGFATAGASGGGIILIAANTLATTSGCTGVGISANGDNAVDTPGNDGSGGAGAGGSIVLQIPNYTINASCQLTVEANGGDGGDVQNNDTHGGGGGGGMGVVIYSIPTPTTNITTNTDPGNGGSNDNTGTGGTAPPGGGTSGIGGGIVDDSNTPLPVESLDFKGRSQGNQVLLDWTTTAEINNDYFEVQMSRDGQGFATVGKVDGRGTTSENQQYSFGHFNPYTGITYYRLKQVDFDGQFEISRTIYVDHVLSFEPFQVNVYPNPVTNNVLHLKIVTDRDADVSLILNNYQGHLINRYEIDSYQLLNEITIDCNSFPSGIYFLSAKQGNYYAIKKIIIP